MQMYWILMSVFGYSNLDFGGEFAIPTQYKILFGCTSLTLTLFFTSVNSNLLHSRQKPEDYYSISAHVSTCTHKYTHTHTFQNKTAATANLSIFKNAEQRF